MPLTGEIATAQPVMVIVGPTAVGKTDVAIAVAMALGAEIINADSRQIYRYMDIGTAKPTPSQQASVPHHLVDIVDPDEIFNVTDFQRAAFAAIEAIHGRGHLPMIVGGTGQYVSATIEGWQFPGVAPNLALRAELEAYAQSEGWQALLERLRLHDPVSAEQIDGQNIRRVIRALEVSLETGRPFSDFQKKVPPGYAVQSFCLTLEPREALYERADQRIQQMLDAGFVDEVRYLVDQGYTWDLPAMSALGYPQIGDYLQGDVTLSEVVVELQRATHRFIRRQMTWFRKYNADARWLQSDGAADEILFMVENWLRTLAG
ncbi:MAG: tRNA (adenosine(37)-N6)-dimethylallyltransferase MiaA [Chloroflexi bacterium]|nr:tRNA (adenosine(37)-N6)-dimethylallyltransferase MiaA [Chloroflexota bacterium]